MTQLTGENIAPQVYAAYKTKTSFKAEPTRVENISFQGEELPVFIVSLGNMKGLIPIYETGTGIFDGSKRDYLKLSPQEQSEIRRRMINLLASEYPLDVKVVSIDNDIVYLSRKRALKNQTQEILKELGVESIKEAEGKTVETTVMALKNDGAVCAIGGIPAYLPRFEIDYTNPRPQRVLKVGQKLNVKIMKADDEIVVSRKALLPDPWDKMDYKEGSIVKGKIIKPRQNGHGYVIAFEPGITGIARNFSPNYIPQPFEPVAVRIDVINSKKRFIVGKIIQ